MAEKTVSVHIDTYGLPFRLGPYFPIQQTSYPAFFPILKFSFILACSPSTWPCLAPLSWKMTGFCQYHLHLHLSLLDLTSSSFLSLQRAYISLIFNVPVFLQSFNSRYLYLVPTILLKLLWLRLQMTPAGLLLLGFCAASDTAGLFPALVFHGFPTLTTGLSKVLFFGLFPGYVFCLDNLSHLIPTIILPWHQWLPDPHLHWCLKSHSPALKPSEISFPAKGVLLFLYVEYELTILISTSCRSCQF